MPCMWRDDPCFSTEMLVHMLAYQCWTVDMSCVWRADPASLQGDAGTHLSISLLDCGHVLSVAGLACFSTEMMVQMLALLNIV